jgi:hypothetical protein
MTLEEPDLQISAARADVLAWLASQQPANYESNAELSRAFFEFIALETDLELRVQRNPSACVYEARWYHRGRETKEFPKPFCAEDEADARLLACAGMVRLDYD